MHALFAIGSTTKATRRSSSPCWPAIQDDITR